MNPLAIRIAADLKAFKANMAEMKVQLETNQASMKRMSSAFDGSKVIGDANAMVKAIDSIGGASKLTEVEMRKVNATTTEALAKYKALGREAPPELLALRDATAKIPPELEKIPSLTDKVNAKMMALGVAAGAFLGQLAWSAVNKLGAEIGVFVERGSQLGALESSFKTLSRGVNVSASEMLKGMRTASRGLVSDFDLMKSANKAMLLGLPVTSAEMGTLTKAATTLGRAMGLDATKSVDDLITALGRSSPMILDNLGLTVKVGEANEIYAAKMKKTVEQLSDAEKKTAFYEEAMRKAEIKTKELGDQTSTLGEILQRTWTSFGNVVTSVVSDFNVGIGSALSNMRNFGLFLDTAMKSGLGAAIQLMATFEKTKGAVAALTAEQIAMDAAFAKSFAAQQAKSGVYTAELAKVRAELAALSPEVIANFKAAEKLGKSNEDLAKVLGLSTSHVTLLKDQLRAAESQLKSSQSETKKFTEDLKSLGDKYDNLIKQGIPASQIVERLGKDALEASARALELGKGLGVIPPKLIDIGRQYVITTALQKADQEVAKLTPGIVAANVKATADWVAARNKAEADILAKATATVAEILALHETELQTKLRQAELWRDQSLRSVEALKTKEPEIYRFVTERIRDEYRDRVNMAKSSAEQQVSVLAQAFASLPAIIIGALQGGGDVVKSIMSQLGSALLGAGSALNNLLNSGLSSLATKVGGGFVASLASSISAALPGIGALLGPALVSLGGKLLGALGLGKNQGREDAKAFAAAMGGFDALRQKMLALGAEGERMWIALTQNTRGPEQVAATIREIEKALAGLNAQQDQLERFDGFMGPEGARGFPTRAQLAQAAADAKATWEYIRDSGEYNAREVTQAWEAWQAAAIAAGDEVVAALKDIDAEMQGLQASVDAEAWEEEMGSIEKAERARLEALEAERAAVMENIDEQRSAEEAAAAAAAASAKKEFDKAKDMAKDLDDEFYRIFSKGYDVPIRFNMPNMPGGSGGSGGGGTGGGSGFRPWAMPQRSSGNTTIQVTVVSKLDGEVLGRSTVKTIAKLLPAELDFIGA